MDGHTVGEVPRAEEFDWEDPFFEGFVLPKTGVSIVITYGHGKNTCFNLLLS